MTKVPKDEICPQCGGLETLCSHPEYDGDHCPERKDCCDRPCKYILDCPTCKGEGLVTFAQMNRYVLKQSKITWGKEKKA